MDITRDGVELLRLIYLDNFQGVEPLSQGMRTSVKKLHDHFAFIEAGFISRRAVLAVAIRMWPADPWRNTKCVSTLEPFRPGPLGACWVGYSGQQ